MPTKLPAMSALRMNSCASISTGLGDPWRERLAAIGERPGQADEDVEGEGERGDIEADGVDGEVRKREPEPGDSERDRDRKRHAEKGSGGDLVRGGGRGDEQRKDEQGAGDLACCGNGEAAPRQRSVSRPPPPRRAGRSPAGW